MMADRGSKQPILLWILASFTGRAMRPRSAESSREIFTAEKIEDRR
jgi:hypothetical protein